MLEIIQTWSPIIVALVAIIPTIIANRKKTTEQIDALHAEVKEISADLKNHINEDEDENAETWRVRILQLDNSIRHSDHYPTQELLQQGRRDCDKYTAYCERKKSFHNGIGQSAMKRIIQTDEYCASHNCYEAPKVIDK